MMLDSPSPVGKRGPRHTRGLPLLGWSRADQEAWEEACRPHERLKRGGRAAHLALVTRKDLQARYGLFLGFLFAEGRFDPLARPAAQVTPKNVMAYLDDLRRRLSSVTLYGSIYKLRRMAEILRPDVDFAWLREIENDLDFLKVPLPKHHRLVLTEEIVLAALTFIEEAEMTKVLRPFSAPSVFAMALWSRCSHCVRSESGPSLHSALARPSLLSRTAGGSFFALNTPSPGDRTSGRW